MLSIGTLTQIKRQHNQLITDYPQHIKKRKSLYCFPIVFYNHKPFLWRDLLGRRLTLFTKGIFNVINNKNQRLWSRLISGIRSCVYQYWSEQRVFTALGHCIEGRTFFAILKAPPDYFFVQDPARNSRTNERNSLQPKRVTNDGCKRCETAKFLRKSSANFQ